MERLAKMSWSGELSVGNVRIDKDHKKLIAIYNDLVELIESNGNREEFAIILSQMTNYVLKHFKNEEEYMHKFGYPRFSEHKELHDDYSYKVAMYNAELLGDDPPDPAEVLSYLERWWKNHILTKDAAYEEYKKEIDSKVIYKNFSD